MLNGWLLVGWLMLIGIRFMVRRLRLTLGVPNVGILVMWCWSVDCVMRLSG